MAKSKTDTSADAVTDAPEAEVPVEATTPAPDAEVAPVEAPIAEEPVPEASVEVPVAVTPAPVVEAPAPTQGVITPEQAATTDAVPTPAALPIVSHNSTFVEWPSDIWGMTTEFKEAIVRLASRVQGAIDKKRIVDEVFNIGRAHFEAKFTVDAKVRQDAIDAVVAQNEGTEVEVAPAQAELF